MKNSFFLLAALLFMGNAHAQTTVTIGTQIWMSKNLDVSTYRDGTPIPQVTDPSIFAGLTTGAWCYYEYNSANSDIYGKLYNWYAVNDPRGLAPDGWHVPSDEEWTILTDYLGGKNGAGTKMKSASGWKDNGNGNNSSGFAGLPGGYSNTDGLFGLIGGYGYWWSSTDNENYNSYAWFRQLFYSIGSINRSEMGAKQCGFSVRCLRN